MTQQQIDLIKKEQDQFFSLETGPITQFMEVEEKQMNHPSFPRSKVTEDLGKELDLDFSHDKNAVRKKNLISKKDISNAIETQNCLSSISYRNIKVYSSTKVKAQNFLTNIS